jgi:hypothetical protein
MIVAAAPELSQTELTCLRNLIRVLLPCPGGLRRWSVMRSVRQLIEADGREVPARFEDKLERVFRSHCGEYSECVEPGPGTQRDRATRLFYRPKDRAGEVWAVNAGKARAWLGTMDHIGMNEPDELSVS